MICPYCSVEMSPIDLSGKIFCSNCGMTIGNNSKPSSVPAPTISHIQTDTEGNEPIEKPATPITRPTQQEAGIIKQDESQKVRDELMKMMTPAAKPVQATNQPPEPTPQTEAIETEKQETVVAPDKPEAKDRPETATPGMGSSTQPDSVSSQESPKPPIKLSVTNSTPQAKKPERITETGESPGVDLPKDKQSEGFSEKVKEIDTLGASGVLLDILDDTAIAKQREQKTEVLKAAGNLIDDLNFESDKKPIKKIPVSYSKALETKEPEEVKKPEPVKNNPAKPTVPVFTPEEIEAALTGKELPKKAEEKPLDKNDFKPSKDDAIDALVQTTAEDLRKEQTYNQDMDNPNGAEVKSAAVKNYFNNIFKKA